MLRTAVVIGLAALYDTVEGSSHALPFELDADGCVVDYQPDVDYYPPKRRATIVVDTADFSITYHKTYKVVKNLPTNLSYILRHCGTPEALGLPGLPADAVDSPVFDVPVKKWSSGLTTTYTFLEELDLIAHAAVLDNKYMSSPCGQKLVACGVIDAPQGGYPAPDVNWKAEVEKSDSEVHFTDKPSAGTAATGLSIDVAFDASFDEGLLNRAEWLKFAAAFFNKEPEANRVFEGIKSRFEAIVEKVAAVEKGTALPVVAFFNAGKGGIYDGCAYGGSELKITSGYREHLVTHGGGTPHDTALGEKWCAPKAGCVAYICPNATAFREVLKTIDVVIDETYAYSPSSYTFETFKANYGLTDDDLANASETSADYPFLASSRVYRLDKRTSPANGGLDWSESALPYADEALLDFALAIVPQLKDETLTHAGESEVLADRPTRWLRDLATGEASAAVDPSDCDDPNKLGSSLLAGRVCFTKMQATIAGQVTNAAKMQAEIAGLQADNARLQAGTIKVVFA